MQAIKGISEEVSSQKIGHDPVKSHFKS